MTSRQDFHCEACALSNQALYLAAAEADALVAKGLRLSLVSRIARSELRLQRLLQAAWKNRAKQSVSVATRALARGADAKSTTLTALAPLRLWSGDVTKPFKHSVREIHTLARKAGWDKATGKSKSSLAYGKADLTALVAKAKVIPDFGLVDKDVLRQLENTQMIWVDGNYSPALREAVANAVKRSLKKGEGRSEMAARLKQALENLFFEDGVGMPHGFNGTYDQYFETVAANVATTARNHAQIRSFHELGVERYVIVNPMDHRTSEICIYMNGKEFTVDQGMSQIESELESTTPDEYKSAHPWVGLSEFRDMTSTQGHVSDDESSRLAEAGLAFPPYHGKCRSIADLII